MTVDDQRGMYYFVRAFAEYDESSERKRVGEQVDLLVRVTGLADWDCSQMLYYFCRSDGSNAEAVASILVRFWTMAYEQGRADALSEAVKDLSVKHKAKARRKV